MQQHVMAIFWNIYVLDGIPLQHGFQRGLSCESQLIEFIDDVTKNLDQGKQTHNGFFQSF
jgi:hypothetical protein